MAEKPNILWFVADQMRADTLAHLGNPASVTPNLDRLAEEGASFAHAYCQNPVCSPSRCSFLTGLYPHARGTAPCITSCGLKTTTFSSP